MVILVNVVNKVILANLVILVNLEILVNLVILVICMTPELWVDFVGRVGLCG